MRTQKIFAELRCRMIRENSNQKELAEIAGIADATMTDRMAGRSFFRVNEINRMAAEHSGIGLLPVLLCPGELSQPQLLAVPVPNEEYCNANEKVEARWEPGRKRWRVNAQRNGERKTFCSTVPGLRGKKEAERKADSWNEAPAFPMKIVIPW